mmetsp:Transcript_12186/g.51323  ORF Transcript_12186/g.51323 Transcript_12186/m.51323 type:complete len:277 (+) Transcript_12186:1365-2195(+)
MRPHSTCRPNSMAYMCLRTWPPPREGSDRPRHPRRRHETLKSGGRQTRSPPLLSRTAPTSRRLHGTAMPGIVLSCSYSAGRERLTTPSRSTSWVQSSARTKHVQLHWRPQRQPLRVVLVHKQVHTPRRQRRFESARPSCVTMRSCVGPHLHTWPALGRRGPLQACLLHPLLPVQASIWAIALHPLVPLWRPPRLALRLVERSSHGSQRGCCASVLACLRPRVPPRSTGPATRRRSYFRAKATGWAAVEGQRPEASFRVRASCCRPSSQVYRWLAMR